VDVLNDRLTTQRVLAGRPLFQPNRCFADTGLTAAGFATTFRDDVTAAATAFVRATQSLNRPSSPRPLNGGPAGRATSSPPHSPYSTQ
jgi:hypothetical protein